MARSSKPTRRDVLKTAGAVTVAAAASRLAAPAIRKVKAANNQVTYGIIGTGSRGQYLLRHLSKIDSGRCVAVCDIYEPNLKKGAAAIGNNPAMYADYREVLNRKDIDAILVVVPLYEHFPITRDALLAGKHVFCEKSLVFKPEEVHALRKLVNERPKQILQVGLQRRYSEFYQATKQMIDKGVLGTVTNVNAQWNRNPGWTMKPFPTRQREMNWRLFREFSGGLTAELGSHQVDVADWMFGAKPEYVTGVGGLDFRKDGRDVNDNIQLILRYPKGRTMMYQAVSTNRHLDMFGGTRTEFGEMIMGTEGTIEITVGLDTEPAIALWFYEPGPAKPAPATGQEKATVASASLTTLAAGRRGVPLLLPRDTVTDKDSFLARELKYARRWMYSKGVMLPQEPRNPVDTQLDAFFDATRTLKKPAADLEIGLADSTMVILSNLAIDEGRRVYFSEIEKMGLEPKKT
jgi:predicted dehydrogenase